MVSMSLFTSVLFSIEMRAFSAENLLQKEEVSRRKSCAGRRHRGRKEYSGEEVWPKECCGGRRYRGRKKYRGKKSVLRYILKKTQSDI